MSPKKIKILHTIRQGQIGGGESHVLDLVDKLDRNVFECTVLSFTEGEMVNRLADMGVKCEVLYTEKPFDIKIWGKVKSFLAGNDFDIVHAHGTRACSNTFWGANALKLPFIYTVHGWSFHSGQGALEQKLRKLGERFLVGRTARNILVSESNWRDGVEYLGLEHAEIIYNGVNLQRFNPDQDYKLRRNDLGLPEDKLIVGMVARLTPQKDPLTFIKAAGHTLEKTKDLHFLLVGGGELQEECMKLTDDLGIGEYITFEDFRTDIPAVLNLMDIYCLPSLWEGLPIGVLEAMAMRKAVIATPVDGTRELVRHTYTGMFFKERDDKELSRILIDLSNNQPKRIKLGINSRQLIESEFSLDRMVKKISELYNRILSST